MGVSPRRHGVQVGDDQQSRTGLGMDEEIGPWVIGNWEARDGKAALPEPALQEGDQGAFLAAGRGDRDQPGEQVLQERFQVLHEIHALPRSVGG